MPKETSIYRKRYVNATKETSIYKKRPPYTKRDLHKQKEVREYQKRPPYTKRELRVHKETWDNMGAIAPFAEQKRHTYTEKILLSTKRDLNIRKTEVQMHQEI